MSPQDVCKICYCKLIDAHLRTYLKLKPRLKHWYTQLKHIHNTSCREHKYQQSSPTNMQNDWINILNKKTELQTNSYQSIMVLFMHGLKNLWSHPARCPDTNIRWMCTKVRYTACMGQRMQRNRSVKISEFDNRCASIPLRIQVNQNILTFYVPVNNKLRVHLQ